MEKLISNVSRKLDEEENFLWKFKIKTVTAGNKRVGILIALKWTNSVISVKRVSSRFLNIRLLIGSVMVSITCVYTPQPGLATLEKMFLRITSWMHFINKTFETKFVIAAGDFNGQIGKKYQGIEDQHCRKVYTYSCGGNDSLIVHILASDQTWNWYEMLK